MTARDMLALAERAEKADASEQGAILEGAWLLLNGGWNLRDVSDASIDGFMSWERAKRPFDRMLGAEAYESAAMTLLPEGWSRRSTWCPKAHYPARWSLHPPGPVPATNHDMAVQACGYTEAGTLCAAALRARAEGGVDG
jgi:hypothetical protein